MTLGSKQLIDGYLDETLSPDEHAALNRWLKETPENTKQFAQAVLFHDRLRSEHLALATISLGNLPSPAKSPSPLSRRRYQPFAAIVGAVITAAVLFAALWKGIGETPASAAVIEFNRIIAANAQPTDRTYQITVEESVLPQRRGQHAEPPDRGRPPKPPMAGAVLHVRSGGQFVLVRQAADGASFITGSNGQTSWAVRPDGPVRFSSDLSRFSHDLPGHEHSMPLINIQDGLIRLREVYEVQLLPIETQDGSATDAEPSRLIVAVKKRGHRGPKRVEITYSVRSGLIQQMRFIEMPYGPEHLTLRMTLIEERPLDQKFFDHASHHSVDRTIEEE